MKVTAKEISKQLGVSIATVDRVLNNRANVSEKMRKRVLEKAEEMGYVPNRMASILSRKVTFHVAVVYKEYPAYFWEQIEAGIAQAELELRDYGVTVHRFRLPVEAFTESPERIQEILADETIDAVAIAALGDAVSPYLKESKKPICTFNVDAQNSGRLFYVGCDYHSSGRLAAELVAKLVPEQGKVGVLLGGNNDYQAREKLEGFREGLREFRLELCKAIRLEEHDLPFQPGQQWQKEVTGLDGLYVATAELGNVADFFSKYPEHQVAALVGHDMNDLIYKHLHTQMIAATITQDPVSQGYLAIKKLFSLMVLEEEDANQSTITKLEIVMKNNASYYT
ncbi:LacI family transcriptional regulator [Shouchella clausii]|nr:LacI family transcriptional regulator [Shouchella clausii]